MTVKKSRCSTLQNTSVENNSVKETNIKHENSYLFIPRVLSAICRKYGISSECLVIQCLTPWLLLGKQSEIYKSSKDLAKEIGVSLSSVKRTYKKFQEDLSFCPFIKPKIRTKNNFKVSYFSLDIDSLKYFVENGGFSNKKDELTGVTSEPGAKMQQCQSLSPVPVSKLEPGTRFTSDTGINNEINNEVNSERKDPLSIPSFKDFVEKNPSVKTHPNYPSAKPIFDKLSDTEKIESVKAGDGYQIYLDRCLESKCKPEQPTWYLKNKLWQGNPQRNNNQQMTTSDAARILKNQASSFEETKIALVTHFPLLQTSTIDFEASTTYIKAYSLYSKRQIQDFIPEIEKVSQRKVVLNEQTISYS